MRRYSKSECLFEYKGTINFVNAEEEEGKVKENIYRCPRKCPWKKKCFICKTQGNATGSITILHKCIVTKEDIPIQIGTI